MTNDHSMRLYGLVRPACESTHLQLSTTSTVGTIDSLCIARIAPLDTTWCTASGSPIEPEGLPCTSHWVLLCTRLLIMDSVLSSLETLVLCVLVNKPINDGLGDYDTRRDRI